MNVSFLFNNFTFNWNFVERDYVPYDDWAFFAYSINGNAAQITKFASLASVGPGSGTTVNGWEQMELDITATGDYTFYFGVVNALDNALSSTLWIDGVSGSGSLNTGTSVPEPSTLAIFALGMIGLASRRFKKQF